MHINTAFYYYGDIGEEPATPVEVPASPAGHPYASESQEGTACIGHADVADPNIALHAMQIPHGLTDTPARRGCVDCILAKGRTMRKLTCMSTTVAKQYGAIPTTDPSRITEGAVPTTIGGRQHLFCNTYRARHSGHVGLAISTGGDAVAYDIISCCRT